MSAAVKTKATTKKPRAKPQRRCWGRLRNVDVNGALFHFTMVKAKRGKDGAVTEPGGVQVRRRCKRGIAETVGFESLVAGAGVVFEFEKAEFRGRFTDKGVELRRKGYKKWQLVPWSELVSVAKDPAAARQFEMEAVVTEARKQQPKKDNQLL